MISPWPCWLWAGSAGRSDLYEGSNDITVVLYALGVRSVVRFGRINQSKSKIVFRTINENKIRNTRTQLAQKLDTLK
jgi:hypothetical protein